MSLYFGYRIPQSGSNTMYFNNCSTLSWWNNTTTIIQRFRMYDTTKTKFIPSTTFTRANGPRTVTIGILQTKNVMARDECHINIRVRILQNQINWWLRTFLMNEWTLNNWWRNSINFHDFIKHLSLSFVCCLTLVTTYYFTFHTHHFFYISFVWFIKLW